MENISLEAAEHIFAVFSFRQLVGGALDIVTEELGKSRASIHNYHANPKADDLSHIISFIVSNFDIYTSNYTMNYRKPPN